MNVIFEPVEDRDNHPFIHQVYRRPAQVDVFVEVGGYGFGYFAEQRIAVGPEVKGIVALAQFNIIGRQGEGSRCKFVHFREFLFHLLRSVKFVKFIVGNKTCGKELLLEGQPFYIAGFGCFQIH